MSDYILPELMPNILARLPVDDVLRCTSVCKSWYSLITSPSFASSHLKLSSPNQEPLFLVTDYEHMNTSSRYRLYRDNQTFDEVAELDPPFKRDWAIVDTLNGLVCLYDYLGKGTIMLWNPSLKKSLILPKSRVLSDSMACHTVGFGFVATSNDYKIVSFSYDTNTQRGKAEIYELSTGSWRGLKLEDHSNVNVDFQQAHLNGILHWYKHIPEQGNHTFSTCICSFDLKDEKFGTVMVPYCLRNNDVFFKLSTFKESLCLIDGTLSKSCNIWVMKEYGVADSWENLFIIDTEYCWLTCWFNFRQNGEILFVNYCGTFNGEAELVSYNCTNNQGKNHGLLANCDATSVHTYVESLVLIRGANEVEINA